MFSDCFLGLQELLLSGMPEIDIDDWEHNTECISGYDEDSQVVKVSQSGWAYGRGLWLSLALANISQQSSHFLN